MTRVCKLSEQAKAAKRQYQREWNKNNPEKATKHYIDFWERKAQTFNDGEGTKGNEY